MPRRPAAAPAPMYEAAVDGLIAAARVGDVDAIAAARHAPDAAALAAVERPMLAHVPGIVVVSQGRARRENEQRWRSEVRARALALLGLGTAWEQRLLTAIRAQHAPGAPAAPARRARSRHPNAFVLTQPVESPMPASVERGTFVPRAPAPITAVRYDGTAAAANAVLALFRDHFARLGAPAGDVLVLQFPDGTARVPAGAWVWFENHGYDRAPATVLDDAAFRAAYAPVP